MHGSSYSEISDASTLENLFCLVVIGITSYSIYNKLDLGAQISKSVFLKLQMQMMVPYAIFDEDSQIILNLLTAILALSVLYTLKLFLAHQLRVPGLKSRFGFPSFRQISDYDYLGHLFTKVEKSRLESSPEFQHMSTLRGGTENKELWNWQTRNKMAHESSEEARDGDLYSVGSLEFENENPGLFGKS